MSILEILKYNSKQIIILPKNLKPYKMKKKKKEKKENLEVLTSQQLSKIKGGKADGGGDHDTGSGGNGGGRRNN